ncbi:MAG: hypothetical protein IPJ79_08875 [Bacteroidetes bacterium]|nr:hypothetical protein [Bacteroidota bacterium]
MNANGGTPPYSGDGNYFNVSAGVYNYLITDANGCTYTASITLVDPPQVTATTTVVNTTCGLNNGSATVTPANGFAPYSFVWSPGGQTTQTATALAAGNYTVLITDIKGCSTTASASISNSGSLPSTPGAINGPSGACRNQSGVVFSVAAVAGATSYSWTLPAGATGSSTTNSITIAFNNSYSGGNISVKANNTCGSSANSNKSIIRYTGAPATPGPVTGSQNICGPQTSTYTVALLPMQPAIPSILSIGGGSRQP